MDDKNITRTPSLIDVAVEAMGFEPETTINLLDTPKTPAHREGGREYQRHVAIEWEGGVLWLNMFDFVNYEDAENPHFCIDVRQFNSAGQVKGEGVFTMSRGYRGSIATIANKADVVDDAADEAMVQGRGWNGGYVVSILTDPDGQETHTDERKK